MRLLVLFKAVNAGGCKPPPYADSEAACVFLKHDQNPRTVEVLAPTPPNFLRRMLDKFSDLWYTVCRTNRKGERP